MYKKKKKYNRGILKMEHAMIFLAYFAFNLQCAHKKVWGR